ncbi:hypothetical protein [Mesorhizobium koreense]|jgi:hypothetical protein|uniref:hypothetical protein n=1 Tax=Mesorhizobium koreense TaxID=3074855 RepID=UPI00287BA6F6|nr:hypothetical protein [Mesorhizobium sp. WR6]
MKLRSIVGVALACASLSACAKNPESIAPMTMPINAYSGLDCRQLGSEHQKTSLQLQQVEAAQRQAVTGDAVGVFLIGVPVSSLSGSDRAGEVAQYKGEMVAIESAQRNRHCM